jgi:hypothetical protein
MEVKRCEVPLAKELLDQARNKPFLDNGLEHGIVFRVLN